MNIGSRMADGGERSSYLMYFSLGPNETYVFFTVPESPNHIRSIYIRIHTVYKKRSTKPVGGSNQVYPI